MARAGILSPSRGPRREYRFGFQDLVLLRSARSLVEASVPRRRVHRALRLLVRQLPAGRRPSEVRLVAEGGAIVASDGACAWRPEDGQTVLDFHPPAEAPVTTFSPLGIGGKEAEEWYQYAIDLEGFDVTGAKRAYLEALDRDPSHVGAHVNYGRLIQAEAPDEAIRHYRAALDVAPDNATAAFNLGTALEASGDVPEAIAAYRLALSAHPALAEAHFNISRLYQQTGHKLAALVHLKRYRELVH